MIPNNIIQIWSGPEPLPLFVQAAIVNVKLLHPDFEHRLYDDAMIDAFVETYFPEYRVEHRSFPFRIQTYDFFRYLAVYHFGGFYLDTDVFLVKSLTPLLGSTCVFPFEELAARRYFWTQFKMDWQIANYAFGAEPRHPFMAAVIENCLRAKRTPAWVQPMMEGVPRMLRNDVYVLNTTGPGMVSRTLAENPHFGESVSILFPDDVCDDRSWNQFGEYGVHKMAGSWRPGTNVIRRIAIRLWRQRNLRRVLAEGRARGKTRQMPSMHHAARLTPPIATEPTVAGRPTEW